MFKNNSPILNTTKARFFFLLICAALILLSGCTAQNSDVPPNYRWASVEGSQLQAAQAGEQFYFQIPVKAGSRAESAPLKIKVSGQVVRGSLRFELRRPQGQVVWHSGTINPGDFSISTEYDLTTAPTGTYTLGLVYSNDTLATYNLSWHALQLGPLVLLPGTGMLLVALAFVIYPARRRWLGWRWLGLGALFWVLTVALKFAFAIPVNPLVYRALGVTSDHLFSSGNLLAYLYLGALTGIFEAGLAWVVLRKLRWGQADWQQALVFGIGFGAFEAFLLGLAGFGSALAGLLAPAALPIPTLGNLANNATFVMGLAPIVERLSVIFAHIFACVLVFYAIASGEAKWGWLAILYKTLLDAPAGFAAFWGTGTADKLWSLEAVIAMFGLLGVWGTLRIARRYAQIKPKAGL